MNSADTMSRLAFFSIPGQRGDVGFNDVLRFLVYLFEDNFIQKDPEMVGPLKVFFSTDPDVRVFIESGIPSYDKDLDESKHLEFKKDVGDGIKLFECIKYIANKTDTLGPIKISSERSFLQKLETAYKKGRFSCIFGFGFDGNFYRKDDGEWQYSIIYKTGKKSGFDSFKSSKRYGSWDGVFADFLVKHSNVVGGAMVEGVLQECEPYLTWTEPVEEPETPDPVSETVVIEIGKYVLPESP